MTLKRSTEVSDRVRLGISACLLGERVRFDAGHKRDAFLADTLGAFVDWVPVCPEEEAGLGTPREAMRLVRTGEQVRLVTVRTRRDVTEGLRSYSERRAAELRAQDLDGFVLKKDSPSCGLMRVKVYADDGQPQRCERGVFAEALCSTAPLLPIEEEGRLHDPAIREHFIERVFAHRRLRSLLSGDGRPGDLVSFHTAHKLLLLAHSPAAYAQLGRMVARAGGASPARVLKEYGRSFMAAVATVAGSGRHVNVLQHAAGYLRDVISVDARRDLALAITDYQNAVVPLIVPIRLIAHHVKVHQIRYLAGQTYFEPYPKELMLRNRV